MKNLTKVLTESASYVASVTGDKNILTKQGFREIIHDASLTEDYIARLTEGFNADHREVLSGLMGQTIKQAVIQESYDMLSPFQALSLPLLRVLWPYNSLKDAFQTIVATTPTFLLTAKKYYLVKTVGGTKVRLALPKHSSEIADNPNGELLSKDLTASFVPTAGALSAYIAPTSLGAAAAAGLTTDVQVTAVSIGSIAIAVPKHGWDTGKNIVVNFVNQEIDDDLFLTAKIILVPDLEAGKVGVILAGALSGTTGLPAFLADNSTGGPPAVLQAIDFDITVQASVSEKWNENQWDFEYQTESFSVTIPDGKHVSAPLPVELVQDVKNLYNLDIASEFGNGMRMAFADAFDIQGINFLRDTLNAAYPGALAAALAGTAGTATDSVTPIKVFNTMPQVGYMGDLVQWRSNTMKDLLEILATTLETEWYIKYGTITVIGHPIDTRLLHGVNWTFKQGQASGEEVVNDYSVGVFEGAGKVFKLVSSVRATKGVVYVLLTPSEQDVMTLRFYPYYYGLETGNGYRSAEHPNVPSITFIRRHMFEKMIPAVGALVVRNNAGSPDYAGFNYE